MNKMTDYKSVINQLTEKDDKYRSIYEIGLQTVEDLQGLETWLLTLAYSEQLRSCMRLISNQVFRRYLDLVSKSNTDSDYVTIKHIAKLISARPSNPYQLESDKVDLS